jgi:hypothetical protein
MAATAAQARVARLLQWSMPTWLRISKPIHRRPGTSRTCHRLIARAAASSDVPCRRLPGPGREARRGPGSSHRRAATVRHRRAGRPACIHPARIDLRGGAERARGGRWGLKAAGPVARVTCEGHVVLGSRAQVTCSGHMLRSRARVTCSGHVVLGPRAQVTCSGHMLRSRARVTCSGHVLGSRLQRVGARALGRRGDHAKGRSESIWVGPFRSESILSQSESSRSESILSQSESSRSESIRGYLEQRGAAEGGGRVEPSTHGSRGAPPPPPAPAPPPPPPPPAPPPPPPPVPLPLRTAAGAHRLQAVYRRAAEGSAGLRVGSFGVPGSSPRHGPPWRLLPRWGEPVQDMGPGSRLPGSRARVRGLILSPLTHPLS